MASAEQERLLRESDELYDRYAKPFEGEHWGEFIAIAPDGRFMLGDSRSRLLSDAADAFGPGNFLFKVGERSVGRIR
jgi:hypothetical protein